MKSTLEAHEKFLMCFPHGVLMKEEQRHIIAMHVP
jgi:hypothetical protein